MDPFSMVVAIVAIAVAAGIIKSYLKTRAAAGGTLSQDQEQRIARLEDRVRALEAVITDQGYDLKQRFHDLEHG